MRVRCEGRSEKDGSVRVGVRGWECEGEARVGVRCEGGAYLRQGLGKQHSETRKHDVWGVGWVACPHHPPLGAAVHLNLLGSSVGIIQVL